MVRRKKEEPKEEPIKEKKKKLLELSQYKLTQLAVEASALCPGYVEKILALENDTKLHEGSPAHYCRYFYWLARAMKPSLCVDIGTHKGMSSACLAAGHPGGNVITLDIIDTAYDRICLLPNIERRICGSGDMGETMGMDAGIDILFIDAEHDGVQPLKQYNTYLHFMKKRSLILFDDINLNNGMRKFWRKFDPIVGEKFELRIHGDVGFGAVLINT